MFEEVDHEANIALDLLGQARLLLARAVAADPALGPPMRAGSQMPEAALAFLRADREVRNVRLVEAENVDFNATIAGILIFASWRLALFRRVTANRDRVLSAVAVNGVKETTYHRDYAGRWFLTLARGANESRRRGLEGLTAVWPRRAELFRSHHLERRLAEADIEVDPTEVVDEVDAIQKQVFVRSVIVRPDVSPLAGVCGKTGRDGLHTEVFSRLLAEMQVVPRAHPLGIR